VFTFRFDEDEDEEKMSFDDSSRQRTAKADH
jgi:hypothetical protein